MNLWAKQELLGTRGYCGQIINLCAEEGLEGTRGYCGQRRELQINMWAEKGPVNR